MLILDFRPYYFLIHRS